MRSIKALSHTAFLCSLLASGSALAEMGFYDDSCTDSTIPDCEPVWDRMFFSTASDDSSAALMASQQQADTYISFVHGSGGGYGCFKQSYYVYDMQQRHESGLPKPKVAASWNPGGPRYVAGFIVKCNLLNS